MSIPTLKFRKLQKQTMIILNKIEKDVVENGGDISTDDFQAGMSVLKERLINRSGVSMEEYNAKLKELNDAKVAKEKEANEIKIV